MFIEYIKHMGAIGRADHFCASYGFARKWRKLFYWLLEVCIVNSFILFNICLRNSDLDEFSHHKYRKALLQQLVGVVQITRSRRRGRLSTMDKEERLNRKPYFVSTLLGKNTKDCSVQQQKGSRREKKEFTFVRHVLVNVDCTPLIVLRSITLGSITAL